MLGDDGGRNFVAEGPHGGAGGADEDDLVFCELFWQPGVFRCMAPWDF